MTQQGSWRPRPKSARFLNLGPLPYTALETLHDSAIKPHFSPWASKPRPCPESRDSPRNPARQRVTSSEKGAIVERLCDARAVGAKPPSHEIAQKPALN